jgi:hypothetical protein
MSVFVKGQDTLLYPTFFGVLDEEGREMGAGTLE